MKAAGFARFKNLLSIQNTRGYSQQWVRASIKSIHKIVGDKRKGTNLKTKVTRKQSTPNFLKNEHLLPLKCTRTYVSVRIWR